MKYNVIWNGLDRGHEGYWNPLVWYKTLKIIGELGEVYYKDFSSPLYAKLKAEIPSVEWISRESNGSLRSLFRDAREPWQTTGVLEFSEDTVKCTLLGQEINRQEATYSDALIAAFKSNMENDEYPFVIIASAFSELNNGECLTAEQVANAIMPNYRPGNETVAIALADKQENYSATQIRRIRHMLQLIMYTGAITKIDASRYIVSDKKVLSDILMCNNLSWYGILELGKKPSQLITYGAPGTGKSHKTKEETDKWKDNVFRTTFHPDSDYSTFVGAYKPSMSDDAGLVKVYKGETDVVDATQVIQKGISYEFIPQAFIKAYVLAWKKMNDAPNGEDGKPNPEPVFLVIEEINRGNCAQIFGDIFQLLDRNDAWYSEYPIDADEDLKKFLSRPDDKGGLGGLDADAIATKFGIEKKEVELIRDGKHLMLPPNLLIRATMNTSDQSLFPIDSAFKRRWDWEYVPIEDANKNWKIDVGGVKYKWWSFLEKINYLIATETSSEDKQLGYFFVKAKDTMIDAETFVSKVVFFLWGDVFKDNLPDEDVFKYTFKKDGKDDKRLIRFTDFYHPGPGNTKEEWRNKLLTSFLEALKVEKEPPADNDSGQGSSNANGDDAKADE